MLLSSRTTYDLHRMGWLRFDSVMAVAYSSFFHGLFSKAVDFLQMFMEEFTVHLLTN
jgi:hypothetical protein